MHSLMLLGLLGAAAAAAEPVVIEVPAHALESTAASKAPAPATALVGRSGHAMSARIDVNGRIHYDCADAIAARDFRFDTRAARQEQ